MKKEEIKLIQMIETYERSLRTQEKKELLQQIYALGYHEKDMIKLKKELEQHFFLNDQIRKDDFYKNTMEAYHRWFTNISMNEYFEDSWPKLFMYLGCSKEEYKKASVLTLEGIYYKKEEILLQSFIKNEESEFIGYFNTCFPNISSVSAIDFATDYFQNIGMLNFIFEIYDLEFNSLEKIKLGSIWAKQDEAQKLERKM